jgi:toxin ParE1/3/4
MRLVWLPRAQRELRAAFDFVDQDDPAAARALVDRILEAVDRMVDFPHAGRFGRIVGTRELVVVKTRYIVACQIDGDDIEILAVIHTRRRWPETL